MMEVLRFLLMPDEELPPGSSDEDDGPDGAGRGSGAVAVAVAGARDELATMDIGDDVAETEESLPLEIQVAYVLVSKVPTTLITAGSPPREKVDATAGVGHGVAQGEHQDRLKRAPTNLYDDR